MRNAHRNSACTWLQQHQQKVACKWNMQRATNHHHLPHQGLHRHHPHHLIQKLDFSSLLSLLHFPVIIPSIMHKLTRISIPTVTSLFVILTYVRLIIKSRWNYYYYYYIHIPSLVRFPVHFSALLAAPISRQCWRNPANHRTRHLYQSPEWGGSVRLKSVSSATVDPWTCLHIILSNFPSYFLH